MLCGSAARLIGVDRLATFIVEEAPRRTSAATRTRPRVFVFKTIVDPYVGRINLFKVLSGPLAADAHARERAHRRTTSGCTSWSRAGQGARRPPSSAPATSARSRKLDDTTTGDVLAAAGADIAVYVVRGAGAGAGVRDPARSKGDEDKLATALHRLVDEDPALRVDRNAETHQTLLWGMGEIAPARSRSRSSPASSASRSRPRT